jgi:hypothetical protein
MDQRSEKPQRPKTVARERRPYRPPRIEQVDIVPGEAMLGFCKTDAGSGAFGMCGAVCAGIGS